jgi:Helicobacter outer membrane protein
MKRKYTALLIAYFLYSTTYSQEKLKFNPSIEFGIARRAEAFELSDYYNRTSPNFTYYYDALAHFTNTNLAIAINQYVYKKKLTVQLASYFRYNHLYYGKNAQGISNQNQTEYKRLKYDIFIDALYHFKKRKEKSVGIILGAGIGKMNYGTKFKDSLWTGSKNELKTRAFIFTAPRLLLGFEKSNFSFFTIAHGTPDIDYRSNPTIWLEFKLAYAFKIKKDKKVGAQ